MKQTYYRGDIFYADLGRGTGSEQEGYRPVLIIQNNIGNKHSPTVIIAAITSKIGAKAKLPTHCFLEAGTAGLVTPSIVLLEQLRTIDKKRLLLYVGKLKERQLNEVNHALAVSVGLYEKLPGKMTMCLCRTCASRFRDTGHFLVYRCDDSDVGACAYCRKNVGMNYEVIQR
ncbi:type II toxin-antitoxin system PemK/MazF family toxin [Solibaculum mannosilyticum]|uniref:type II toxin-antitoxin system PemK/MazF family toxin n=1 Tax=Solibaculum mannosilyticum TaxID=2780922 RepID=UPI0034C09ECD